MEKIQVALVEPYGTIKVVFEVTEEQYALLKKLDELDLFDDCCIEEDFTTKI